MRNINSYIKQLKKDDSSVRRTVNNINPYHNSFSNRILEEQKILQYRRMRDEEISNSIGSDSGENINENQKTIISYPPPNVWDVNDNYLFGDVVTHNSLLYMAIGNNFANYEPGNSPSQNVWLQLGVTNIRAARITGITGVGVLHQGYGIRFASDLNGTYIETSTPVGFVGSAVTGSNFYKIANLPGEVDGTVYLCAPNGVSNFPSDQTWPNWTLSYISNTRYDYLQNLSTDPSILPKTSWQVFCPNAWDAVYASVINTTSLSISVASYDSTTLQVTLI